MSRDGEGGAGTVAVSGVVYGAHLRGRLPGAFAPFLRPLAEGPAPRRTLDVSWRTVAGWAAVDELWNAEPAPPRTPDRFALFRHAGGVGLAVEADGGAGRFLLAPGEIAVEWRRPAEPAAAAHFFYSHALPLWLEARGVTVLHAAAVARSGRAVAFLGASGAGKSTLTAELVRDGWSFVADDGLAVEEDAAGRWRCLPGPPWLRLWPSALARRLGVEPAPLPRVRQAHDKRRLAAPGSGAPSTSDEPELAALHVLDRRTAAPAPARLDVLPPGESLLRLVEHSLAAAPLAALGLSAPRLDRLARLAARVPVSRLAAAAGDDPLAGVRDALLPAAPRQRPGS
jgi:hypothetical protein